MKKKAGYTIVGGGIATYSALKSLLRYDPGVQVTVVSEKKPCFCYRAMSPLAGEEGGKEGEIFFNDDLPDFRFIHDRAVALDTENKKITLKDHDQLDFDRLLIATGSTVAVPDIPGIKGDNVFSPGAITDAELLKKAAEKGGKVVILGGGLVGIKKAEALNKMGLSVTVVDQQDNILLPRIDRDGAEIITEKLTRKGISIITGDTINSILPGSQGVALESGRRLEADLVCIATGVRPGVDWLRGSSLNIDLALVVDEKMQTSIEGIYGAGDVVQTRDRITFKKIVSALWPDAFEMGKIAGTNMAGGELEYEGSLENLNSTEIEDIPFITAGNIIPRDKGYEIVTQRNNNSYKKLVFQDDRLAGAIFLGNISRAELYTSLIKTGISLGSMKEKLLAGESITYSDFFMKNPMLANYANL
ncbi:MAG: NAD(P)/FAD-dependent oxidoreductase [Thermodesulfobacteriota bacterium]